MAEDWTDAKLMRPVWRKVQGEGSDSHNMRSDWSRARSGTSNERDE
jgi:hypothetical protein